LPTIAPDQHQAILSAIGTHDFLSRVVESLEHYHRLVFHADEGIDWSLVRRSAEQILVAEVISRYGGNIDGVYHALRAMENGGTPWSAAVQELAGAMHSYYTTPLGVVLRKDLFGDDAVFISLEAHEWIRQRRGATTPKG
jgi:hypothetical protein